MTVTKEGRLVFHPPPAGYWEGVQQFKLASPLDDKSDAFIRERVNMQITAIAALGDAVLSTPPADWRYGTQDEWKQERDRCASGVSQASKLMEDLQHERIIEMYAKPRHRKLSRVRVLGFARRSRELFGECEATFQRLMDNGEMDFDIEDREPEDVTRYTL